jgi:hypothetical protein
MAYAPISFNEAVTAPVHKATGFVEQTLINSFLSFAVKGRGSGICKHVDKNFLKKLI